ncbi:hypothetical protein [Sphingomonas sp. CFBP 13720]|uniref:hypothetical protein n=1 Tax=Sphingomonas sp. CFBP 13720 TaxID=2775302 RepID=UPI001784D90D|nr:hypothetical protein [Sphingomonas sp. CFBP 13720]MBD8677913.1 hypothetical protein [Sphingomonas sp. CFBP 13720]
MSLFSAWVCLFTRHASTDAAGCYHRLMDRTVAIALQVLDEAFWPAAKEPQQTSAVRLALHVLRPHAPKQWLIDYWEAAGSADPISRQQNMMRCLNGIRARVKPAER